MDTTFKKYWTFSKKSRNIRKFPHTKQPFFEVWNVMKSLSQRFLYKWSKMDTPSELFQHVVIFLTILYKKKLYKHFTDMFTHFKHFEKFENDWIYNGVLYMCHSTWTQLSKKLDFSKDMKKVSYIFEKKNNNSWKRLELGRLRSLYKWSKMNIFSKKATSFC